LVEVDEHMHSGYDKSCEVSRLSELMDSIDHKCMHVIRYNPHSTATTTEERNRHLLTSITNALKTNLGQFNNTGCVVEYIGYTEDRIAALDELSCVLQQYEDYKPIE
jgi:hypothetical protein